MTKCRWATEPDLGPNVVKFRRPLRRLRRDGVAVRFVASVDEADPSPQIAFDDVVRLWKSGEIGQEEFLAGLADLARRGPEGMRLCAKIWAAADGKE